MLALAVPVVLGELGWMAMGVVDTIMVGGIGAEAIGAVGIGRAVFLTLAVFGIGLLLGLDALISSAFGAGDLEEGQRVLVQGVHLSLAVSLPGVLALRGATGPLEAWGLAPGVLVPARAYLLALSWSLAPLLLFTCFRRYLQAVDRARPVMLALVTANLVNVAANRVLIYGAFGVPALGAAGAGWATVIASAYMAAFLLAAILLHDREERGALARIAHRPDRRRLRRLLALGLPAAGQLVVEVAVFAGATALAGRLEAAALAAHQIALNCASVSYMVPLGLSSAGAVRVGQALGRRDRRGASAAGWTALALAAGFMALAAVAFLALPGPILRAFTSDARVVAIGTSLLAVAAMFQLSDGVQVVGTGVLRGAGDTRTPLVLNLVGHWVLGLPVGYWLCFVRGWGVVGLWLGWVVGLTATGTALVVAWARLARALREAAPAG
jgi:MATE family multidrug resistance protein